MNPKCLLDHCLGGESNPSAMMQLDFLSMLTQTTTRSLAGFRLVSGKASGGFFLFGWCTSLSGLASTAVLLGMHRSRFSVCSWWKQSRLFQMFLSDRLRAADLTC
jgi:hypothetical protein